LSKTISVKEVYGSFVLISITPSILSDIEFDEFIFCIVWIGKSVSVNSGLSPPFIHHIFIKSFSTLLSVKLCRPLIISILPISIIDWKVFSYQYNRYITIKYSIHQIFPYQFSSGNPNKNFCSYLSWENPLVYGDTSKV